MFFREGSSKVLYYEGMSLRSRAVSAFYAAALPLLFLSVPTIAQAAPIGGSLIKLPDDRNPATESDSAVYYYAADGKRYVFPNSSTYFTWYKDFSTVVEIDADALASIPPGGNVVYRAGTRLLKLETDPKVYAVEPRGTLRPLASESAAVALYGAAWAKRVDDLSDAFFVDYKVGTPLDGGVLPTGSVVRRASDGAVLYVDGGSLRWIVSSAIQDALRIRETFILPVSFVLSGYLNGPDLSFAEPALYDSAQIGETAGIVSDRAAFTVRSDALGADRNFVMGSKDATVFRFSLLAASTATNHVRAIAFRAVIDGREGGSLGFSTGSEANGGARIFVRDRIPQASLYDSRGNFLAGPATVAADGQLVFTGLDLPLAAGSTQAFALRADFPIGANFGAAPDAIAFDVTDVARDVAVTDADGRAILEEGAYPNGGLTPREVVTVTDQGSAVFAWRGEVGFAVAGRRVLLGTLKAQTKNDAYDLKAMTVRFTGQLQSISRVELEANGQTVGMPYAGTVADFENLPFKLARDAATIVSAYAVMKPADNGFYGERIQAVVPDTQRFLFVSEANGTIFDQASLREDPRFPLASSASDLYLRFTELSFSKTSDTPSGLVVRSRATPVLRFTAHADASGPARIRRLTFKIEPGDVGSRGAPDALENWAAMNGDALDDVDVMNLWRGDVSSGTAIGEGDDAAEVGIAYSVVSGGVKDATPAGRDSVVNDYGLIEYDFREGDELFIPAGQTTVFTLELATDRFTPGSWKLKASLLGGFDVQWTDTTVGAYTPLTGMVMPGLPLESLQLTVP